jgi:hypothetical protein
VAKRKWQKVPLAQRVRQCADSHKKVLRILDWENKILKMSFPLLLAYQNLTDTDFEHTGWSVIDFADRERPLFRSNNNNFAQELLFCPLNCEKFLASTLASKLAKLLYSPQLYGRGIEQGACPASLCQGNSRSSECSGHFVLVRLPEKFRFVRFADWRTYYERAARFLQSAESLNDACVQQTLAQNGIATQHSSQGFKFRKVRGSRNQLQSRKLDPSVYNMFLVVACMRNRNVCATQDEFLAHTSRYIVVPPRTARIDCMCIFGARGETCNFREPVQLALELLQLERTDCDREYAQLCATAPRRFARLSIPEFHVSLYNAFIEEASASRNPSYHKILDCSPATMGAGATHPPGSVQSMFNRKRGLVRMLTKTRVNFCARAPIVASTMPELWQVGVPHRVFAAFSQASIVLINRQPTLNRSGIAAFDLVCNKHGGDSQQSCCNSEELQTWDTDATRHPDNVLRISPCNMPGFQGDFDGDDISLVAVDPALPQKTCTAQYSHIRIEQLLRDGTACDSAPIASSYNNKVVVYLLSRFNEREMASAVCAALDRAYSLRYSPSSNVYAMGVCGKVCFTTTKSTWGETLKLLLAVLNNGRRYMPRFGSEAHCVTSEILAGIESHIRLATEPGEMRQYLYNLKSFSLLCDIVAFASGVTVSYTELAKASAAIVARREALLRQREPGECDAFVRSRRVLSELSELVASHFAEDSGVRLVIDSGTKGNYAHLAMILCGYTVTIEAFATRFARLAARLNLPHSLDVAEGTVQVAIERGLFEGLDYRQTFVSAAANRQAQVTSIVGTQDAGYTRQLMERGVETHYTTYTRCIRSRSDSESLVPGVFDREQVYEEMLARLAAPSDAATFTQVTSELLHEFHAPASLFGQEHVFADFRQQQGSEERIVVLKSSGQLQTFLY